MLRTRTSVMLPPLPFKADRYDWYLSACGVVTILGWSGTSASGELATYHLAAVGAAGGGEAGHGHSGEWMVGRLPNSVQAGEWKQPVHVLLGGWYDSHTDMVHVIAVPAGGGGHWQVEVGALRSPSPPQLDSCEDVILQWRPVLVAHRGAVFFLRQMSMVKRLTVESSMRVEVRWACGLWRLAHERMEWEMVACLDMPELEQLTGGRYAPGGDMFGDAYGAREFVCPKETSFEKIYCSGTS